MTAPNVGAPDTAAGVAGQARGQITNDTAIVGQADAESKAAANMTATAAMAGWTLRALSSGGWLMCRWGRARELPDLAAVGALLRQMGAR